MGCALISISIALLILLCLVHRLERNLDKQLIFNLAVSAFLYDEFGVTMDDILKNYMENYVRKENEVFMGNE